MKKIIFIFGFILITLFSSCKKTFTCECNQFYNGADTSWVALHGVREFELRKKEDAVNECDKLDGITQVFGTEEYGLNCELK